MEVSGGRTVQVCQQTDPSDTARLSTEHLGSRLKFETLISDTAAELFAAPVEQFDSAIESALERVRIFFQADRCALLSVSDDQQEVMLRIASYSAGLPPKMNLAPLLPWTIRMLLNDRLPLRVSSTSELPPEADIERESWTQMRIRSALIVPIEMVGTVKALILLNTVNEERTWPDIFDTRLRMLGEMLVAALERQQMFAGLRETEEQLVLAADSAAAGLWALDYETHQFWATERSYAMFGFPREQVVTLQDGLAQIHPDDRALVRHVVEHCSQNPDALDVEYRIIRDGEMHWVLSRARRHPTSGGRPLRLMGASIDITDRKRAQEALRTSEARLASAVDLAGIGFYELDSSTGTSFIDERFSDLCGIPPGQEAQALRLWTEYLHSDDRQAVLDLTEKLQAGSLGTISAEYRYLHPTKGQRWIHHIARVAASDETGRAIRTFGVMRDITSRRNAEEALRKSYEEIEKLKNRLQAEGDYLKAEMRLTQPQGPIIGQSAGIRKALRMVEQVAPTDSSVLVCGETGTGKELIAEAIHRLSPRRGRLMVKVNCAALPSGLVESELFGRERGAYTGALTRQVGRFEVADGSTIFLDEIGELSLDVQAKLLRVLEAGEFERLGTARTTKVSVRVIAATNRDLLEAIRQGKFREDLYYRLNVFPIRVPPLRERSEDIPVLVWAFLQEFSSRVGKKITQVPRKTMDALVRHRWPGNVRELRNVIEHGAIISTGDTLRIPALGDAAPKSEPSHTLADSERDLIILSLERTHWRIKGPRGSAAELGLKPATLYSRMKKLGIDPSRHRNNGGNDLTRR